MKLPYDLRTYGIAEDVPLALTILQGEVRTVDIIDQFSHIAIFLDCPEANHVFCLGRDYFERVYSSPVIAMAWRHGLPLQVHRRIPDDEWDLYAAQVDRSEVSDEP